MSENRFIAATRMVVLTPRGVGAIGVIAVSGPLARAILLHLVGNPKRLGTLAIGATARVNLQEFSADRSGAVLDDALAVRVDETAYELHLHGGVAIMEAAMASLQQARSFLLVQGNLAEERDTDAGLSLQREIVAFLSHAHTLTAAKMIAAQGTGGLNGWAREWIEKLNADGNGGISGLREDAARLIDRATRLRHLVYPPRIALIGPPNVGKSTLANALLGRTVAITSPVAGTTRDWVDALAVLTDGALELAVTLVDTAGVHETADPLEELAIQRTHEQAALADVILLLQEGDAASAFLASVTHLGTLRVRSKSDLQPSAGDASVVSISALKGSGLDVLMRRIFEVLLLHDVRVEEAFPFLPRHLALMGELASASGVAEARKLLVSLIR